MVKEAGQDKPQEETIWALRDSIASRLKEKGGSGERRKTIDAIDGVDYIRVVSKNDSGEDTRDYLALIIDADRNWSGEYDTAGYPISNPTIDDLLNVFAQIQEPDLALVLDRVGSSEDRKRQRTQYIEDNRQRLLEDFASSLELSLQRLSA